MDAIQRSEYHTPKLPLPAADLELLNVFVGRWHAEGYYYGEHQAEDDPNISSENWVSDESYEWMSDNYFLIHRWDAKVGGHSVKGLEIIGFDVARNEYFTRKFDNEGNVIKYQVTIANNTWNFIEPFTRTMVNFSDDGNTMTFNGEWRQEGGDWLPLCSREAVRC